MRPTVRDAVEILDQAYPPALAEPWDAVGLVCGDPQAEVDRVLFAVDPVEAVVDEAIDIGAQLVVVHHPLLLAGVHSIAPVDAKGRVLHRLVTSGIALFTAHTNADHAKRGVSDALAGALGLGGLRPLVAIDAMPAVGTGRVGELAEPVTLEQFAEHVAAVLPWTAHGVRIAGDPQQSVRTVAVCGGSGDAFLADAAKAADAYVTSDLRHHRASDHLAEGGCALIDIAHWAGEWPWLALAGDVLAQGLAQRGTTVDIRMSELPTDPWTAHRGSPR